MAEKDEIFSSKVKYTGLFPFSDFYRFSYDWLVDEFGLLVKEEAYTEKIKGDSKDLEFVWMGFKEVTDYFKYEVKVKFRILGMTNVEITQNGAKIKMNSANVEVKMSANLVKDYKGRFETGGIRKFLREIYQKWVIPSRIEQFQQKLFSDCDEFLSQVKSYLDLEGKR